MSGPWLATEHTGFYDMVLAFPSRSPAAIEPQGQDEYPNPVNQILEFEP